MKLRSDLNTLAANICASAASWNGGEKIRMGEIELSISGLTQNILDKMDKYLDEEKSLKGRLETLEGLKKAIQELTDKPKLEDTAKNTLFSTAQRVNQFILQTNQNQKYADAVRPSTYMDEDQELKELPASLEQIIKNAAFRTVKNVGILNEKLQTEKTGGVYPFIAFLSLKQDLETFLNNHQPSLSQRQISEINEAISLLSAAAPIDRELTLLSKLDFLQAVTSYALDAKIADIAYGLEQSIDHLNVGGSVLVPGGFINKDNRHAVVYEVQRVREDEYHFAIYNTADGAELGQEAIRKMKNFFTVAKESDVPRVTNLSKEAVSDQAFLIELLRPRATIPHKNNNNEMDSVYQAIQKHLIKKCQGKQTLREPHDLQTWKTCSFDSIVAFLEYRLPPSLFVPFQFDMIARARGALNSLITQGKIEKAYLPDILDYIDGKSCETLADKKKLFEKHCAPTGELALSKQIDDAKVSNETDLKRFIENLSDKFHTLTQEIKDDKSTVIQTPFDRCIAEAGFTHGMLSSSNTSPEGQLLMQAWELGGFAFCLLKNEPLMGPNPAKTRLHASLAKNLADYEDLLRKISPEQLEILRKRKESLLPGDLSPLFPWLFDPPNRPNLVNLDLSGIMNYLKARLPEIALCAPLLNIAASPLCEALKGCKMLPAS